MLDCGNTTSTGVVYCSAQETSPPNLETKLELQLEQHMRRLTSRSTKPTVTKVANQLRGIIEIFNVLNVKKGFMRLDEAYELYSAHQIGFTNKETFVKLLTDREKGLNVHIVQLVFNGVCTRFVVKKTPCLSIGQILLSLQQTVEEILGKQIERLNIDATTFQAIQNTLGTEWDRLCARCCLQQTFLNKKFNLWASYCH